MKSKAPYFIILFLVPLFLNAASSHTVFNLRCEQEETPVGLETLQPRFSWQTNATGRNFEQSAWQILVSDSPEQLQNNKGDIWDSGKVESSVSVLVPFAGKELKAGAVYYWKVRNWDKAGNYSPWSQVASFSVGLLSEKDWNGARWIALERDKKEELLPVGLHGFSSYVKKFPEGKKIGFYLLPQFRKTFTTNKTVKRAVAYISGLGQFELFINGKKIGNNFLDPGWTKYDKCALYLTFDVTNQIQNGDNTVGVMLGNGFFNIPSERYFKVLASYGAPRLKMKLAIEYADGSMQNLVTGTDWKASASPVTYSSIYGGEDYDANREQSGWMMPGFNDKNWSKALDTNWQTKLLSQQSTPLHVRDSISPIRIFKNQKGQWVYDLGQNFSGIVRISVKASKAQYIKIWPAELLFADSTVDQRGSGSPYWFGYTPKADGRQENWQPQFTYYGFRYVAVEGAVPAGKSNAEGLPEIAELTGLHTCNSADEVGCFHCSKPLFNQIYELIDWAIRSNMASVLTDCPHREKLGWLEQSHLMQNSMQSRYDLSRLYAKIMNDMQSAQQADGMIPTIAPEIVHFEGGFRDTPEWGSAFIIDPWNIYQWYGDKRLIEKYYFDMQRYIDYLSSKANDHIVAYGLGDWLDLGPKSPGEAQLTSNGLSATATYYYDVTRMQKMAELLGKKDDAKKYTELGNAIKEAFNKRFWNPSKQQYEFNSQTASAMALFMELVPSENRQRVLDNLISDIRVHNNSLTTGEVGYTYLISVLQENEASNVIYDMNNIYNTPGYGWQLAHGATALTESWQGYAYLSNNHLCLGHLMGWFFSGLGGIGQADQSIAFKQIVIHPQPAGDVREAQTSYQSPHGQIVSNWKRSDKDFTLHVEIPANATASVYLPATNPENITESGILLKEANMPFRDESNKYTVVTIGSGSYNFNVKQ